MPLQRSTIGVCHALLWFAEQTVPAYSAKVFHTNVLSCTMWERHFTNYVTNYDVIPPLNRARHTTYSIPN
jgi:hypothetical protein